MAVKPIPEGYHTIAPALTVEHCKEAIDFYKRAFGAKERYVMPGPQGTIAHAELEIGDSVVMLSDPFPQGSTKTPNELGGTTVSIFCYVEDVDSIFNQAVEAGATVHMPVDNQFWGDRFGTLIDPYGHAWGIATHVEDVPAEEMERRSQQFMAEMAASAS